MLQGLSDETEEVRTVALKADETEEEAHMLTYADACSVMPQGLSDETEEVRTVALKAGHGMVDNYADTAMPMILPAIEGGLFANEWRIR
jgi:hypothetical protein